MPYSFAKCSQSLEAHSPLLLQTIWINNGTAFLFQFQFIIIISRWCIENNWNMRVVRYLEMLLLIHLSTKRMNTECNMYNTCMGASSEWEIHFGLIIVMSTQTHKQAAMVASVAHLRKNDIRWIMNVLNIQQVYFSQKTFAAESRMMRRMKTKLSIFTLLIK